MMPQHTLKLVPSCRELPGSQALGGRARYCAEYFRTVASSTIEQAMNDFTEEREPKKKQGLPASFLLLMLLCGTASN